MRPMKGAPPSAEHELAALGQTKGRRRKLTGKQCQSSKMERKNGKRGERKKRYIKSNGLRLKYFLWEDEMDKDKFPVHLFSKRWTFF